MRIALVGYGKMGKEIEQIALERKHEIVAIVDKDNMNDMQSTAFRSAQAVIEFTTPETAFDNITTCLTLGLPVVCGTTGWLSRMDDVKKLCVEKNGTFFYASNYSVGVNIFFHLNRELARVMQRFASYEVSMEEIHHTHKKDAPSGTAITLADDIIQLLDRKTAWVNSHSGVDTDLSITSIREGAVPGTHIVSYESDADMISIRHEAKSRRGFALGAVIAAEFVNGKKGIFSMKDVLGI